VSPGAVARNCASREDPERLRKAFESARGIAASFHAMMRFCISALVEILSVLPVRVLGGGARSPGRYAADDRAT